MLILYVAPRYHTNQIPIIEGLLKAEYQVRFLARYKGVSENYEALKPDILKSTLITRLQHYIICKRRGEVFAENWMLRHYKPGYFQVLKYLNTVKPDVVILRERSKQSRIVYTCCRILGINKVVLYNQRPLNADEWSRNRFKGMLAKIVFPKTRYTPVKYLNLLNKESPPLPIRENRHTYYVPFVQEPVTLTEEKKYVENGITHILDVGKYRDYKNHRILVEAVSMLTSIKEFHITIIGQVSNEDEQKYFDELSAMIWSKELQSKFTLLKNIPYRRMQEHYKNNDIFVLPSREEVASISILEAMTNGLCTLSTDNNGTAFHVVEGDAGLVFDSTSAEDLAKKLNYLIENPKQVATHGKKAIKYIEDNCGFDKYIESLGYIFKEEFNYKI